MKKSLALQGIIRHLEAAPRLELGMKDLQSSALPLGYAAVTQESIASMSRCVKKMLTARRFGDVGLPYICDREQRGEVYKTQYM